MSCDADASKNDEGESGRKEPRVCHKVAGNGGSHWRGRNCAGKYFRGGCSRRCYFCHYGSSSCLSKCSTGSSDDRSNASTTGEKQNSVFGKQFLKFLLKLGHSLLLFDFYTA